MKLKKQLPAILLTIGVIAIAVLMAATKKNEAILFYGETCPHCKNVDKYIEENNIRELIEFKELEVSKNQGNASLLNQTARNCGLDTMMGIGVPFFYDGEKCLMGDVDIIDYFASLEITE